jgi:hypothetical protein
VRGRWDPSFDTMQFKIFDISRERLCCNRDRGFGHSICSERL